MPNLIKEIWSRLTQKNKIKSQLKEVQPATLSHFENLPSELQLEIFRYLTPSDYLPLKKTNRHFNCFDDSIVYWKEKYKEHFPHRFNQLNDETNIDWENAYKITYSEEYKTLTPRQRKLFTLVKENNLSALKNENVTIDELINLKLEIISDDNKVSLLDWADKQNNQAMLDYFYELAQNYFATRPYPSVTNRDLLKWAVLCRQSVEIIEGLIPKKYIPQFINHRDTYGLTALHYAAMIGQLEIVKLLLKNDAYNPSNLGGFTPLIFAIIYNHVAIVKELIERFPNEEYRLTFAKPSTPLPFFDGNSLYSGDWPLSIAIRFNRIEIVKLLLRGKDLNYMPPPSAFFSSPPQESSFLMYATSYNQIEIVNFLLQQGANVNLQNQRGYSALLVAAMRGHSQVIDLFLQNKVDINTQVTFSSRFHGCHMMAGSTALHAAIQYKHNEVALTLAQAGASLTMRNVKGQTPIDLATGHLKHQLKLIEYIKQRDNNPKQYKYSFKIGRFSFFDQPITIFNHQFNISKDEKIKAAKALYAFEFENKSKNTLASYTDAYNNGELSSIAKCLKIK